MSAGAGVSNGSACGYLNDHEARTTRRALQNCCAGSKRKRADVAGWSNGTAVGGKKLWFSAAHYPTRCVHPIESAGSTNAAGLALRMGTIKKGSGLANQAPAERWWILATTQKPLGNSRLRGPHDRLKGWTQSKAREQLEAGRLQAVVVFVVLVGVLLGTAWLLVDMLLQIVF